ncbi:hypothetical protein RH915_01365 [Serpentinicella sp. ANB-PHB4]|uniref:hypothetical protein n=1 Tax=Serpentinicella sp. ANB-PHB4 TaxID=3074076 RepID=UPI00285DA6A9|nr:hypothetical protein [Serpentinicella sp. ANB-PHB4]MDR5658128.1 hypothetical protein [Serpentinicella sp. ANB-PHB4]
MGGISISKREKTILMALGVVVFLWGYNNLILTRQVSQVTNLSEELATKEMEYMEIQNNLNLEQQIENEYERLTEEIIKAAENYFTHLNQEELILLLNIFSNKSNIQFSNMGFTQPRIEYLDEDENIPLEVVSLSLAYTGSNSGLDRLIREIEEFDKKIMISQLSTGTDDQGISGNMTLDFYTLGEIIAYRDSIFDESYPTLNPKVNPFASNSGRIQQNDMASEEPTEDETETDLVTEGEVEENEELEDEEREDDQSDTDETLKENEE